MNQSCLICGGTGTDAFMRPCPNCFKEKIKIVKDLYGVPVQYQNVAYDKSFLPEKEQKTYGKYMEDLLNEILTNYAFFQKNILICSRPNSGKTVWSYHLYSALSDKGYTIPKLRDILEVRDIMSSYKNVDEAELYSKARCAIIKIPRDCPPWLFDSVSSIIERRVRNNGFTIFLFGGSLDELKQLDRYEKMKYIMGSGAYNTIEIKSF